MTITRQLRFAKCPKPNLSAETNCARDSITFEKIKANGGEGKVLFSLKYVEKVKSKSGVGVGSGQRRDDGSPRAASLPPVLNYTHTQLTLPRKYEAALFVLYPRWRGFLRSFSGYFYKCVSPTKEVC